LAYGDTAVIRRYPLVPIWMKIFFFQSFDGVFGEVSILKTTATKNHFGLLDFHGNRYHNFT
jgi:hypothetical protein